jgi:hypothetical protein
MTLYVCFTYFDAEHQHVEWRVNIANAVATNTDLKILSPE